MFNDIPQFQAAGALSSSVPGSVGVSIAPAIVVLVYVLLIIIPFLIASLGHIFSGFDVALAKYATRNSWRLLFYHSGLAFLVVIYLFLEANENLHLERSVGYYTASSSISSQAFFAAEDAIFGTSYRSVTGTSGTNSLELAPASNAIPPSSVSQYLKSIGSSFNIFDHYGKDPFRRHRSRQLTNYATGQDIVWVYHNNNWDNMLTSKNLMHVCQAEKNLLDIFKGCAGDDSMATVIPIVFRKNCTYQMSFKEAVAMLTAPANAAFVQDNVQYGPRGATSEVILSYMSWSCLGFTAKQMKNKFDKALQGIPIEVTYAQIDHFKDEISLAMFADVQLLCVSVIGAFLVIGYYYVSLGSAVVCAVICTVVVSTSLLLDFDYTSLSALNMVALLFTAIYSSFFAFAFVEAWERCYQNTSPVNRHNRPTRLNHKFLLVAYRTIQVPLNVCFGTFFTCFISIYYLYPVLSVSQLGEFLFTSLVGSYIFMHAILIPAWLCVVKLRRIAEVTERLGITRASIIEHPDDDEDDATELNDVASSTGRNDNSSETGSNLGSERGRTENRPRSNSHDTTVAGIMLVGLARQDDAQSVASGRPRRNSDTSSSRNRPPRHPQSERNRSATDTSPRRGSASEHENSGDEEGSVHSARSHHSTRSERSCRRESRRSGRNDQRQVASRVQSEDSDDNTVETVETQRRREAAARSLQVTLRPSQSPSRRNHGGDDASVQSAGASVQSTRRSRRSERRSERYDEVSLQDPPDDDTIGSNRDPRPSRTSVRSSPRATEISGLTSESASARISDGSGDSVSRDENGNALTSTQQVQLGFDNIDDDDQEETGVIEAVYVTEACGQRDGRRESHRMSRFITWPVFFMVVAFCIVIPIYMVNNHDYSGVIPTLPVLLRKSENFGEFALIGSRYRHEFIDFRGSTASSYLTVNKNTRSSSSFTSAALTPENAVSLSHHRILNFDEAVESNSVSIALDGDPTGIPSVAPTTSPSLIPTTAPTAVPTTSQPSNVPTTSIPTVIPSSLPTAVPTTSQPSNVPTTSIPTVISSFLPTAVPTTSQPSNAPTTSIPTVIPSFLPTGVPTCIPSGMPSSVPSSRSPTVAPTLVPTVQPSLPPTLAPTRIPTTAPTVLPTQLPTAASTTNISHYVKYTTRVCFGINVFQEARDSIYKAAFSSNKFDKYVSTGGFMADLEDVCLYALNHSYQLDLADSFTIQDCLYSQLNAIMNTNGVDAFEALYQWVTSTVNLTASGNSRADYVGVNRQFVVFGGGNFGLNKEYELLWVCEVFPNVGDVKSMWSNRDHAVYRQTRWRKFLDKEASAAMDEDVSVDVSSTAWLFANLYTDMKQGALHCTLLVVAVCLVLTIFFTKGNVKLVGIIMLSVIFITIMSLLIHIVIVNDRIDMQNFIGIFLFSGCITYLPTQMATRYHFTASRIPFQNRKPDFHFALFKILLRSTVVQCLLVALTSVPLLFAQFTLIAKIGQYGVVVGLVSAIYICGIMPVLLRFQEESTCIPIQKYF